MRPTHCLAACACALLASCAVGPNYHSPTVRLPDHFNAVAQAGSEHDARRAPSSVDFGTWWHTLGDAELDSLIDRAVTHNPSALVALDRLQAARLYEAGLSGSLLPVADASGGYGRGTGSDLTRGRVGQPLHSATTTHNLSNVTTVGGFDAVWEIDIFGKLRREMEQARDDAAATADARNVVLVSVIADVARAYVDLRAMQMRVSVLQSAVAALRQGLENTRQPHTPGINNELDVTLAQRSLATVEAELPIENAEVS